MSWTLAHAFDIIDDLPKYIIKQKGEYYNLLMSLYNCENIETKSITQNNIIEVLNDIFDDKNYYKKIDLQVYQLNKQIYDYPKQIITTIDDINNNVLFYYNFTSEKISLIKFIEYCKSIKTHQLVGISGFNHDQKPIFIKNRNNIFLVYESLHKCKILTNFSYDHDPTDSPVARRVRLKNNEPTDSNFPCLTELKNIFILVKFMF
jgi:hypothetical protein